MHGCGCDLAHRLVIDDFTIAQNPVMAVAGEGIERHIGDDADIGHGLLDGACGLVDQIVRFENVRAGLVALVHFHIGKGGERRDAQIRGHPGRFHRLVHTHPVDAGHRVDRFDDVGAGNNENRPDQVVDGEPGLAGKPARPVGYAGAAHAAVAGDLVHIACGCCRQSCRSLA